MFQALTRIMLALAMALTFAGQMEAAAAHCAQLAQADVAAAEPTSADEPDCHGMTDAAPTHHSAPTDPYDAPAPDHCECMAALKVCAAPATLPESARIAPYAWLRAADARFASLESSPALRPPRA